MTGNGHLPVVTWPWYLGGFTAPLFAGVLARWIADPLAFGISFFVAFTCASFLVGWRSGCKVSVTKTMAGSALGACVGTLVAFAFRQSFLIS